MVFINPPYDDGVPVLFGKRCLSFKSSLGLLPCSKTHKRPRHFLSFASCAQRCCNHCPKLTKDLLQNRLALEFTFQATNMNGSDVHILLRVHVLAELLQLFVGGVAFRGVAFVHAP